MPNAFRLKTVRRVRELRETQAQREFARKRSEVEAKNEGIRAVREQKKGTFRSHNARRIGAFDPQEDLLFVLFLKGLRDKKKELERELEEARERLEKQRSLMEKATTDRKAMDVLHNRFLEGERLLEMNKENLRLSEFSILRFGRGEKKGEG